MGRLLIFLLAAALSPQTSAVLVARSWSQERPHATAQMATAAIRSIVAHDAGIARAVELLRPLVLYTGHPSFPSLSRLWEQRRMPDVDDYDRYVRADMGEIDAQIEDALRRNEHPLADGQAAAPPDLDAAADFICAHGASGVARERDRRERIIAAAVELCASATARIRSWSPEHVQCVEPAPQTGFIAACVRAMEWPDFDLHIKCAVGFECVGIVPASGVFPSAGLDPDIDPATVDFHGLDHFSHRRSVEHQLLRQALRSRHQCQTVWDSTLEECAKGYCDGPFSSDDIDTKYGKGAWRCMLRFGVVQGNKIRPCDNGKASLHNDGTLLYERIVCESADFPLRAAQAFFRRLGPGFAVWLGLDDLEAAYRRIACAHPQFTVFACANPAGGVSFFTMAGFNFGLKSAVLQFNRLAAFLSAAARRLQGVHCSNYFDDFATCEPAFSARSGQHHLGRLLRAMGYPLKADKHLVAKLSNVFLGVETSFARMAAEAVVEMFVPDDRRARLTARVESILDDHYLSTSAAGSLRGALQFLIAWSFGRVGMAALQPLSARQYYDGSDLSLTESLVAALAFFLALLRTRRTVVHHLARPARRIIFVWTDAMWEASSDRPAGIGWVVYIPAVAGCSGPTGWFYSEYSAPADVIAAFVAKASYIGQLELLAAIAPYFSMPAAFADEFVIHFIDNTSAIAGLVKGYAAMPDSARLVHAFHAFNVGVRCVPWFAHVRSKANVSDGPSRGDCDYVVYILGAAYVPTRFPRLDQWLLPAGPWMSLALSFASAPTS